MTDNGDPKRVDATPARRFFVAMLIRDIELIPAIIDLVDNSADGAKRLRTEPGDDRYEGLEVEVEVSPERFKIEDNCGGMSVELARNYAFKFGRSEDTIGPIGEVGQFGIGMKRALFKMGEFFEVTSATETSRFTLPVEVKAWTEEDNTDWSFEFDEVEEDIEIDDENVGTNIEVNKLHEFVAEVFGQEAFVNRLRKDLATRELRLLQQGLTIKVNGQELIAQAPMLLAGDEFTPVHLERELEVDEGSIEMKLWAGLAEPRSGEDDDDVDDGEKYRSDPPAGWYLFCNDRLLLYADKGRLTGWGAEAAAYHPQYSRFRGYVLLEGDASLMPWNTTKTGVDEDSRAFRLVQNEMFDALQKVQAVINRLKKERRQPDEDARPAISALERAEPKPLLDLPSSPSFKVPEPAPDPPPTAQWIRYQVELGDFERVAESVGSDTPSEVGRSTFDWYLRYQVD
ncbi:MAG TPA: ATP-binding protein [Solirubrobacterales bacterium]|nr:ATP-binding protein [Solirubrobacterales bacterium]